MCIFGIKTLCAKLFPYIYKLFGKYCSENTNRIYLLDATLIILA